MIHQLTEEIRQERARIWDIASGESPLKDALLKIHFTRLAALELRLEKMWNQPTDSLLVKP